MNLIKSFNEIEESDRPHVGGKCLALSRMVVHNEMNVPDAVVVCAEAYNQYISLTGLHERILIEINRKDFKDMRWEEIWDTSLRIRNMFLNSPIPDMLYESLRHPLKARFSDTAVVVRSSALEEDTAAASFAGLHESYVNIKGIESILHHIRLVWASLWSDAALLYRQELGLDIQKSSMAVVIQEIVYGQKSGVAFGKNPNDDSQSVIEAVYGLNQGLVDGTVEPDRWILERETGMIVSHTPAQRSKAIVPMKEGVQLNSLSSELANIPPLTTDELNKIFELVHRAEQIFGSPQDVEWTWNRNMLYVLQSRPITSGKAEGDQDKRPWYLSLHRSFDNLKLLRRKIEEDLIPSMIQEASLLGQQDLRQLSDSELAEEVNRRAERYNYWLGVYWKEFIPFAHGIRLFGVFYNDTVSPADPYEFMQLLGATEMESTERNQMLEQMASHIRGDSGLADKLKNHIYEDEQLMKEVHQFIEKYGDISFGTSYCLSDPKSVISLVMELALRAAPKKSLKTGNVEALKNNYLSHFQDEQRTYAAEILDLARVSYRMRDNDNVYLSRIKTQVLQAADQYKISLEKSGKQEIENIDIQKIVESLHENESVQKPYSGRAFDQTGFKMKARQIVGQPAGPGIAEGTARVIIDPSDLSEFKSGEVLICDAIDPSMTFVVPLSAGIVERRGGMLIHGAIIAREYGIPCVTGIPDATTLIQSGDEVTVDGYLGIVIVG
jgi:Phosphoenolpyruvate synthase/pyruvate phosphate dikinase